MAARDNGKTNSEVLNVLHPMKASFKNEIEAVVFQILKKLRKLTTIGLY